MRGGTPGTPLPLGWRYGVMGMATGHHAGRRGLFVVLSLLVGELWDDDHVPVVFQRTGQTSVLTYYRIMHSMQMCALDDTGKAR